MMKITHFAVLLITCLILAACKSDDTPDAKPIAQVSTQSVQQGDLPHIVTAYGVAAASSDASVTLSVQAMGRVGQWLIAPGAKVRQGQPLLRFNLAATAVSAYQQAASAVAVAKSSRAHIAALLVQQLATRDQLDQADKALSDANAALAAIEHDQGHSSTLTVSAPVDGTVISLDATHGDVLAAGTALLTMVRSDGMVAALGLERGDVDQVHVGDTVQLRSIEGSADMRGVIRSIGHAIDPRTHQVNVTANVDGPLMVGEMLRGDIVASQWHGWIVPRDAVLGDDDHYVFQIDGTHAVRVPVSVLGESGSSMAVSGSLQANRPLAVTGADQLDDGMDVRSDKGATR